MTMLAICFLNLHDLQMRTWDEAAKVQGMVVPGLESYADRIARVVDAELATRS